MKKSEFISLRAERIYNAINNSFEFPGCYYRPYL